MAKYFAILPAMFMAAYPRDRAPQRHAARLARERHPLGGDLQRARHRGPHPARAARGVAYRPLGAAALLRRSLLVYGVGGVVVPFVGIKLIDVLLSLVHLV